MEVIKKLPIVVMIVAPVLIIALLYTAYSWSKSLWEPPPETVNTEYIVRRFESFGVQVSIDKLLYIQVDYNAYIFEGDVQTPDVVFNWFEDDLYGHRIAAEQFDQVFPDSYGLLAHTVNADGKDIWAIVVSTTGGEWAQGEPMFEKKWKAIVTSD